jgi:hypothetical protein
MYCDNVAWVRGMAKRAMRALDGGHMHAFAPFIYKNEHFAKTGSGQT